MSCSWSYSYTYTNIHISGQNHAQTKVQRPNGSSNYTWVTVTTVTPQKITPESWKLHLHQYIQWNLRIKHMLGQGVLSFMRRLKCTSIIGVGMSRFVPYREVFFIPSASLIGGSTVSGQDHEQTKVQRPKSSSNYTWVMLAIVTPQNITPEGWKF